jgi:hypothetical protein
MQKTEMDIWMFLICLNRFSSITIGRSQLKHPFKMNVVAFVALDKKVILNTIVFLFYHGELAYLCNLKKTLSSSLQRTSGNRHISGPQEVSEHTDDLGAGTSLGRGWKSADLC